MVARSRTRPPTLTSSTCSRTRSQPRSLLSIARLNKARLRARRSTWSRTRIDHTSLGFRGRFCPIRRPLFQGSRRGTDGRLLFSMIVSSEPTAPSRLRSDQGRQGILSPVVGLLLKPTRSSPAANGSPLPPFGTSFESAQLGGNASFPACQGPVRFTLRKGVINGPKHQHPILPLLQCCC